MLYIALCLLYFALFSYIIYKWAFFSSSILPKKYFIVAFLLKTFTGIFIWELYTNNIGVTDADVFFNDSKQLFQIAFESPVSFFKLVFGYNCDSLELMKYTPRMLLWQEDFNTVLFNDSRTMIRVNAIVHFFSFGFFHVHTIFSSFLSLIGLNLVFQSIINVSKANKKLLFAAVFLIPSVLFWSSVVMKESLVFIGMGLLLYNTEWGLKKRYSFKNVIGVLFGILFMFSIKYYLLLSIIPALVSNLIYTWLYPRRIFLIYSFVLFACFVLFTQIQKIVPQMDPVKSIKAKQLNFNKIAKGGVFLYGKDNYIQVDYLKRKEQLIYKNDTICLLKPEYSYKHFHQNYTDTTFVSGQGDTTLYRVLFSIPPSNSRTDIVPVGEGSIGFFISCLKANLKLLFLNGLLDQQNIYSYLAFLENCFFLLIFLLLIRYKICDNKLNPFVFSMLSFVLILNALIGITTPVWGSIVRYRMPVLLFMAILFVVLFDFEKFKKEFKRPQKE